MAYFSDVVELCERPSLSDELNRVSGVVDATRSAVLRRVRWDEQSWIGMRPVRYTALTCTGELAPTKEDLLALVPSDEGDTMSTCLGVYDTHPEF
jgi:hypothetical protein